MTKILVSSFYKFTRIATVKNLQEELLEKCLANNVAGTIILAEEGINGTIAGAKADVSKIISLLNSYKFITPIEHKESWTTKMPFYRMKVRLKKEIVTMGIPDINPAYSTGVYVNPSEWNNLVMDPDVAVIDTRNNYETAIGTFDNAICPNINSFRELPDWIDQNNHKLKNKKIAMFCTGGIRCEKSTALMRKKGFQDVFHLKGGILKYLEEILPEKSKWNGQCFVFDQRVSVEYGLKQGTYSLCYACRYPVSEKEKKSQNFTAGINCPHCYDKQSQSRRSRFKERQKQIELAKLRNEKHIGMKSKGCITSDMNDVD